MRIEAENLQEAFKKAAEKLNCSVTELDIKILQNPIYLFYHILKLKLFFSYQFPFNLQSYKIYYHFRCIINVCLLLSAIFINNLVIKLSFFLRSSLASLKRISSSTNTVSVFFEKLTLSSI